MASQASRASAHASWIVGLSYQRFFQSVMLKNGMRNGYGEEALRLAARALNDEGRAAL